MQLCIIIIFFICVSRDTVAYNCFTYKQYIVDGATSHCITCNRDKKIIHTKFRLYEVVILELKAFTNNCTEVPTIWQVLFIEYSFFFLETLYACIVLLEVYSRECIYSLC